MENRTKSKTDRKFNMKSSESRKKTTIDVERQLYDRRDPALEEDPISDLRQRNPFIIFNRQRNVEYSETQKRLKNAVNEVYHQCVVNRMPVVLYHPHCRRASLRPTSYTKALSKTQMDFRLQRPILHNNNNQIKKCVSFGSDIGNPAEHQLQQQSSSTSTVIRPREISLQHNNSRLSEEESTRIRAMISETATASETQAEEIMNAALVLSKRMT